MCYADLLVFEKLVPACLVRQSWWSQGAYVTFYIQGDRPPKYFFSALGLAKVTITGILYMYVYIYREMYTQRYRRWEAARSLNPRVTFDIVAKHMEAFQRQS